jgi:sugar/nucleoside kinase (ribokinase family)
MYINELPDTSFIKDLKGYVTADVCNGKPINVNLEALKFINLLLISDEDIDSTLELAALVNSVKDYVVLHSSTGSTIYCKNGWQYTSKAEHVPNINVLGAGDKFASYVLIGLDNSRSIDKVIQEAHNKLTEYFKNEKI